MFSKISFAAKPATFLVVIGVALGGCATSDSSTYSRTNVGQIIETSQGYVIASRPVKIRDTNAGAIGTAGGAAVGGVIGSTVASGTEGTLATVAGALIGAGVGYLTEQQLRGGQGVEYIVETDDGRTVTIVQNQNGNDAPIPDGTPVMIQFGSEYTRLVPMSGRAPAGRRSGSDDWVNPDQNPGYDPNAPYDPNVSTAPDSGNIVQ